MVISSMEDEDSKSSFYRKMHNDCAKHKLFLTKMHNIFEMLCIFLFTNEFCYVKLFLGDEHGTN